MLPIGDEVTDKLYRTIVLTGIIIANFIVWFIEVSKNRAELQQFFQDWGAVPATISDGDQLYTLVTSAFLHGSWGHILGNMLFLWVFGQVVEQVMGHIKFLIFYLICAVAGSLAYVLIDRESQVVLVGASGAIAGVMGAYMAFFPKGNLRTLVFLWIVPLVFLIPAWIWIGGWFLTQLLAGVGELRGPDTGVGGGVAYFAHVGGLLCGYLLALIFRDKEALQKYQAEREGNQSFSKVGPWRPSRGTR